MNAPLGWKTKVVQIQASKERDPERRSEILMKTHEKEKKARQIRLDLKMIGSKEGEKPHPGANVEDRSHEIEGRKKRALRQDVFFIP
jgi:hypothetical protein